MNINLPLGLYIGCRVIYVIRTELLSGHMQCVLTHEHKEMDYFSLQRSCICTHVEFFPGDLGQQEVRALPGSGVLND